MKILLILMLLVGSAFAAPYVIFDEATNIVLDYKTRGHTDDAFRARTDVIIDPDVSALTSVPLKYWKHSSGSIVEMTTAEKAAVDANEATYNANLLKLEAKNQIDAADNTADTLAYYSLIDQLIGEINVLRAIEGLADIKLEDVILKAKTDIDAGNYD